MKFKVFPSYDRVKTDTESNVKVIVKGEGETRLLSFNKPIRMMELSKLESLKIAFALLGRVGICGICGSPFRRKASTGHYAKARFCSRECFYKWCRKTGGSLGLHSLTKLNKAMWKPEEIDNINVIDVDGSIPKAAKVVTHEDHVKWGREGGRKTQRLHPHVKKNLQQYKETTE